jgi:hypothetical protein
MLFNDECQAQSACKAMPMHNRHINGFFLLKSADMKNQHTSANRTSRFIANGISLT